MPRDMMADEAWGESGEIEKQKRKPVRRDAEKRRQQNIQAQRRYRQKIRGRLESLEALAATAQQESPPLTIMGSEQTESTSLAHDAQNAPELSMLDLSTATSSDCESLLSPFNLATSHMNMNTGDSTFSWDPSIWDFSNTAPLSHQDISPSSLNVLDPDTDTSPEALEMVLSSMNKDNSSIKNQNICRATTTMECACDKPHLQITAHDLGPSGHVEVKLLNIGSVIPEAAAAPDPYVNHIRLDSICTLAAMDTLRMQIGITEDMMCCEDFPSPFYRPIRASAHEAPKQNLVHAVQKIFKALHPDLRPSTEQITVEHPPYIDALPFQSLRKNLILRKDEIDADEFLRDLVTGLVCWGGAGLGKRDRNTSTGYASTGTPWDNRSWEGKVWFLRKYWSILGGEEGELVRQSEWWRGMRGEEVSLNSTTLA